MRSLALINRRPHGDLFEDLWNEVERNLSNRTGVSRAAGVFSPALDIEEKDGVYLVSVDLPGIKKEDVKIDLLEGVLTISGERPRVENGEGKYAERRYGKFQRSFTLPHKVDAERIEAKMEDGVLQIRLPQIQEAKTHTIKIQ